MPSAPGWTRGYAWLVVDDTEDHLSRDQSEAGDIRERLINRLIFS